MGHAIGGLIAGWLVAGAPAISRPSTPSAARRASRRARLRAAIRASAPFALLAMAPDLDLLVHRHSAYTHSLGAAALVSLAAAALAPRGRRRLVFALACGLAYASHVLLDWLATDTSPPLGIMALWPFSTDHYLSGLGWFLPTDRRYWLDGFVWRNLQALARELLLLVPIAALTLWLRQPRTPRAPRVRRDADAPPAPHA